MAPEPPYEPPRPSVESEAAAVATQEAVRALSNGPIGAYLIAAIAVGVLFIGWLAFYFLLFMPRGAIG
jgi:hypothetical protein